MNKKNYFRIIFIITLLLAAGFFGYRYFFKPNTKEIKINGELAENNEPVKINGENNTADNTGEIKNADSQTIPVADDAPNKAASDNNSSGNEKINIINKLVSWGYQEATGRKIDTIIIHSVYDALESDPFSVAGVLKEYKQYKVSAHYLIDREGNIYQLVADKNIAYHAGESQMPDGRTDVNNFSIGIELINTKTDKYTSAQYSTLNKLLAILKSEYKIKYVLGHNQIAPGRKDDPWNIDWDKVNK